MGDPLQGLTYLAGEMNDLIGPTDDRKDGDKYVFLLDETDFYGLSSVSMRDLRPSSLSQGSDILYQEPNYDDLVGIQFRLYYYIQN